MENKRIKYQKHAAGCYGYKLVCVDVKFGKPFNLTINNFTNSMIEEKKYCSDVILHFNKQLMLTKEDSENFRNSTKC